jgi:hypothetical protein
VVGTQQRSFAAPRAALCSLRDKRYNPSLFKSCAIFGVILSRIIGYALSLLSGHLLLGGYLRCHRFLTGDANVISKTLNRASVLLLRYLLYRQMCHGTGMSPCGGCFIDKSRFSYVREQRFDIYMS